MTIPPDLRSATDVASASASASRREKELKVEVRLRGGLGVSVVNHSPPEELAYCRLTNICLELVTGPGSQSVDASVQSIQIGKL